MVSNDVHVVFGFVDVNHKLHRKSYTFVKLNSRRKYISLATVRHSFVRTYKNHIKEVGSAICCSVLNCKKERENSPVKKETNWYITTLVEADVNKQLNELEKKYNYSGLDLIKKMLLCDFSIPELYFESKKLGDFKEKFIIDAEKYSSEKLDSFLNKFNSKKLMKKAEYTNYGENLSRIKMSDYEDRKICAELFSYGLEFGEIKFLTFDNAFRKYLNKFGKENNVKVLSV